RACALTNGATGPLLKLERVKGVEPSTSAWKAEVLPLNYTRILINLLLLYYSRTLPLHLQADSRKYGASGQLEANSMMSRSSLNYTRIFKTMEGVGLEPTNPMGADLQSAAFGQLRYPSTIISKVVARDGIEPPTQGFSVLCSTD